MWLPSAAAGAAKRPHELVPSNRRKSRPQADAIKLDPASVLAIITVETNGLSFEPDGRTPMYLFESAFLYPPAEGRAFCRPRSRRGDEALKSERLSRSVAGVDHADDRQTADAYLTRAAGGARRFRRPAHGGARLSPRWRDTKFIREQACRLRQRAEKLSGRSRRAGRLR